MRMPDVPCPVAGCDYSTGDFDNVVVAALLTAHTAGAHSVNQPRRSPKVDRPICYPCNARYQCLHTQDGGWTA